MSDAIDMSNGRTNFANDTGDREWWGLPGARIEKGDSLETIIAKGGLNWDVLSAPAVYTTASGITRTFDNRRVLYRADTEAPLGVVSDNRYQIHQNADVVGVFRDALGISMKTIGALEGGRAIFATAAVDGEMKGPDGTILRPFVTVTTRHDGSGATQLFDSTVRVVCANTLRMALDTAQSNLRVSHTLDFDSRELARAFGLAGEQFAAKAAEWNKRFDKLACRRMTRDESRAAFAALLEINLAELGQRDASGKLKVSTKASNALEALLESYYTAPGAAPGTAWGALQAVTHYADHVANVRDSYGDGEESARVSSSQFGAGHAFKTKAVHRLMAMAA